MANDCQFRLDSRIRVALPVRVSYRGSDRKARTEDACACDVSRLGARLVGLRAVPKVGEEIEIQYGARKAPFRVMWELGGHVGAQSLRDTDTIWDSVGPLAQLKTNAPQATCTGALNVKIVPPKQYFEHLSGGSGATEPSAENAVLVCLDPEKPKSFRALGPPQYHMTVSAAKKIENHIARKIALDQGRSIATVPGEEVNDGKFFVDLLSQSTSWQCSAEGKNEAVPEEFETNRDIVHGVTRGIGMLVSRRDASQQYKVEFMFEIVTELIARAGDRWAGSKVTGSGQVRSLGGRDIRPGDYDLETSDGEVLHVNNAHGNWIIVDK